MSIKPREFIITDHTDNSGFTIHEATVKEKEFFEKYGKMAACNVMFVREIIHPCPVDREGYEKERDEEAQILYSNSLGKMWPQAVGYYEKSLIRQGADWAFTRSQKEIERIEADSVRANFKWALQKVELESEILKLKSAMECAKEGLNSIENMSQYKGFPQHASTAFETLTRISEILDASDEGEA